MFNLKASHIAEIWLALKYITSHKTTGLVCPAKPEPYSQSVSMKTVKDVVLKINNNCLIKLPNAMKTKASLIPYYIHFIKYHVNEFFSPNGLTAVRDFFVTHSN